MSSWLVNLKPQEGAHVRLIAFPHAGGSANAYRTWDDLPPEVELWAMQPPGRWPRHAEAPCGSFEELRDGILEALRPTIDAGVPFAFFRHSFGCIVAVEVARALKDWALPLPLTLLLSAHPAPGLTLEGSQAALSQNRTDEVRARPSASSSAAARPTASSCSSGAT